MDKDKVIALAKLARIDVSDTEAESLAHEFEGILGYVAEVKKAVSGDDEKEKPALRNVLREDVSPHESGLYTEAILKQAPQREGEFVAVKKIL
ncbi:MAG: glutamyl-tRNA(Gln) and/or aspartyl-tRNA(Asn) amidotransferase subunit [Parcubacteria group bacterium]|nr:glutamyl-tRNA(Gln) and/or aspartyl-tRNA(Asn) amidotransferase subunit [Parcubacteria group bacterium]